MSLFDEAARFAVEAHAGMVRKGDGMPYVLHPFEVATIAATMTYDVEVLSAALLHDVLEDTASEKDELLALFGQRVVNLVLSETEDKRPGQSAAATWRTRKEESLAKLARAKDPGVSILWLSDKLANLRSLRRLADHRGDQMWDVFHQKDPREHAWYYRSVAKHTQKLSGFPAWQEYARLLDEVFGPEEVE